MTHEHECNKQGLPTSALFGFDCVTRGWCVCDCGAIRDLGHHGLWKLPLALKPRSEIQLAAESLTALLQAHGQKAVTKVESKRLSILSAIIHRYIDGE